LALPDAVAAAQPPVLYASSWRIQAARLRQVFSRVDRAVDATRDALLLREEGARMEGHAGIGGGGADEDELHPQARERGESLLHHGGVATCSKA
jgi:hypothetical protein